MEYKINQTSNDVIESIYNNRGINDDEIDKWLYADSSAWEDPSNYPDIDKAYRLLMKCINENKPIFINQDPDCDGVFSAGILINFILKYLKYEDVYYIIQDGKRHGLTNKVMDKCLENKPGLLINPDSSSNDIKQMKKLVWEGINVICLDHHNYSDDLINNENVAIVNNQHENVKNKYGSGCFVTYKFIFYVAEREGIDIGYDYLDCCNVANIADMMRMNTDNLENRYVYNVASEIPNVKNKLLKSFIKDLNKKKKLTFEDVSYGIAPKINSIIRIGNEDDKTALVESAIGLTDEEVSYKYRGQIKTQSIYESIIRISNRCKSSQKSQIERYIKNGLEVLTKDDDKLIIVNGGDINPNLRGLLANKLMGEYKKPILILSGNEELRGSARGIGDISFKDMCESSGLVMFAQGHESSFGIGLFKENIDKFITYINKRLLGVDLTNKIEIDYVYENGTVPLDDVLDLGAIDDVWCGDCKRPKLLVRNIHINSKDIIKRGIDLSFKIDNVIYKKEFCSKVFYEKMICAEENKFNNKDLEIDIICSVKVFENGRAYICIEDCESRIIQ